MTAAVTDPALGQLPASCLADASSAPSTASLTPPLPASQNGSSPAGSTHASSSPPGSIRKQAGDQLSSLPEDRQVLGFDSPEPGVTVPPDGPGTTGEHAAPEDAQPSSLPQVSWHKSSARRSVRITEPGELEGVSTAAATDSGGIAAGASARSSRRSMRRRSTGEADVEAMLMARSSDQLLSTFPTDHRPSRLQLPDGDTQLPHQTYPSQDPASPPASAHPLSPFERLLQARSGLTSLRQRRSSSQPQQPIMQHHADPQDADEMARRQAIIANLLQPRASMALSRSSLTVERRTSNLMCPESKYANVSSQSESASGKQLTGGSGKAGEAGGSSMDAEARRQRGKVSAPNSPSGHARVLDHAGVDCNMSGCSTPTEALSTLGDRLGYTAGLQQSPGSRTDTGGPGGSPLGVKASNSRSSKKSQGPSSSRNFPPGDGASGRRRSNHIFDVLPDLLPLLDGEQGSQSHPKALLHQNRELRLGLEMTQQENEKLKARLEHAQEEILALREAERRKLPGSGGGGGGLLGCMPLFRKASVHTDMPAKM